MDDEVIYPSLSDPRNPSFQTVYVTGIDPADGLPSPVTNQPPSAPAAAAGGLVDTLLGNDGTRILGFTPIMAAGIAAAAFYFLNEK